MKCLLAYIDAILTRFQWLVGIQNSNNPEPYQKDYLEAIG